MDNKKIFIEGYFTKDIPDTAPDFILGKGSFKVDELIAFLQKYKPLAVDGFLNFSTLRSKEGGKRYTELDLYQFNQQSDQVKEDAMIKLRNPDYPTPTEVGVDINEMNAILSGEKPIVTAEDLGEIDF